MSEYFNPLSELDIRTAGNLPHWEQGSVWYFVTFRLADALPRAVVDEIQYQREQWRRAHDLQNLSREELAEYHRLFSERYETLLDAGSGSCVLRDPENAEIVCGALRFFDGQRYVMDEYVVMPNHVHLLVKPLAGWGLAEILHSWKFFTAKRINHRLGRTGAFWQHESYDHIVRNESAMYTIRRYIRENPGKVGGASSSKRGAREQDAPATIVGGASSSQRGAREQDAPATIVEGASSSLSEAREQDAPTTIVGGASSSLSEAREQDAPATILGGASNALSEELEHDAPATISESPMTILYFAQARRLAGIASESLSLTEPVNADALWSAILARHPELAPLRSVTRLARNGEFAAGAALFAPGDEVALIPPVSGG